MKDRDFLMWIHKRLEEQHGEDPKVDYMYKLRAIIASMPADKDTPNSCVASNLDSLVSLLEENDKANDEARKNLMLDALSRDELYQIIESRNGTLYTLEA